MKRKITFILFGIFALSIILFSVFGEEIRNYYSPHVKVMPFIEYIFPDGAYTLSALANSCITVDEEGISTAYIVEEKASEGERAFYIKRVEIKTGNSDDKHTEIRGFSDFKALFVVFTDRTLVDGKRVVLDGIEINP